MKFISFSIFFIFSSFPFQVTADDYRIIYSSSLTGNLYSCICGLKLSVGLGKRLAFFKQNGISHEKDILVDTGNSLDVKSTTNKAKAIFESFQTLGYHSIGIGQNDLQESSLSILEANTYLTQSANLSKKGFFGSSKLGKSVTYLKRKTKTFGIINLTSPSVFYNLSKEIKSKLLLKDLESTVTEITSLEIDFLVDNWIILLHGSQEEALKIASLNKNYIVIFGGEPLIKPSLNRSGYLEVNGIKVYSTGDLLGDKIGILNLKESESGLIVKSSEIIEMNVNQLTDSEEILDIMKKYNLKPE